MGGPGPLHGLHALIPLLGTQLQDKDWTRSWRTSWPRHDLRLLSVTSRCWAVGPPLLPPNLQSGSVCWRHLMWDSDTLQPTGRGAGCSLQNHAGTRHSHENEPLAPLGVGGAAVHTSGLGLGGLGPGCGQMSPRLQVPRPSSNAFKAALKTTRRDAKNEHIINEDGTSQESKPNPRPQKAKNGPEAVFLFFLSRGPFNRPAFSSPAHPGWPCPSQNGCIC